MIGFFMIHFNRPPLWLRRFRILGLSLSTIVRMMDLLLGFDLLDPAFGKEPAVNLLNCLEAQKEVVSALVPITNGQLFQLL